VGGNIACSWYVVKRRGSRTRAVPMEQVRERQEDWQCRVRVGGGGRTRIRVRRDEAQNMSHGCELLCYFLRQWRSVRLCSLALRMTQSLAAAAAAAAEHGDKDDI
jgi:hypothetical protein